jgi:hypothetical protein
MNFANGFFLRVPSCPLWLIRLVFPITRDVGDHGDSGALRAPPGLFPLSLQTKALPRFDPWETQA